MRDLTDDPTNNKSRQDFDDQQNELAGRETGRMTRFGVGGDAARDLAEKKKRERAFRTALQLLMDDPEYAQLYKDLGSSLSVAEHKTDTAIEQAQELLLAARQELEGILDRAPLLPNGKRVFRDENGAVYDEDGEIVPAEIADGILWPDDAPGNHEYRVQLDRVGALDTHLGDLNAYRTDTLGGIRNNYDDQDNPMSKDDMQDALDAILKDSPPVPEAIASLEDNQMSKVVVPSTVAIPDFSN